MSSIADRRAAALAEFAKAKALGYQYNAWAELAEELAALLPATKAKGDLDRAVWADYRSPRWRQQGYERCEFNFRFADGECVRVSHPSDYRKPYNWGEASRVAIAFWKLRKARKAGRHGRDGDRYERALTPAAITAMECNGVCGKRAAA